MDCSASHRTPPASLHRAVRKSRRFRQRPEDRKRRRSRSPRRSRNCFARVSARSFMSSFVPKCRQPVGQDLMQAGSRPSLTRSEHSVHLYTRFVSGVELWNVERAAGDAIAAADAIDPAGNPRCHWCTARWRHRRDMLPGSPAPRNACTGVCASAIAGCCLRAGCSLKQNQIPIIPARFRHRLIGVVKHGRRERHAVPFHAGHFTRFAADTSGGVDQLADFQFSLDVLAGNTSRSGPRFFVCVVSPGSCLLSYAFCTFTRNPLNSGVYAFGSITVGVNAVDRAFARSSLRLPRCRGIPSG